MYQLFLYNQSIQHLYCKSIAYLFLQSFLYNHFILDILQPLYPAILVILALNSLCLIEGIIYDSITNNMYYPIKLKLKLKLKLT